MLFLLQTVESSILSDYSSLYDPYLPFSDISRLPYIPSRSYLCIGPALGQDNRACFPEKHGESPNDGNGIPRKKQKRRSSENNQDNGGYIHEIFNPEKSDNLTLATEKLTAIINERECRIYDFRLEDERPMGPGKPKRIVEEGRVFIDIESGMPLRLSSFMVEGPDAIKRFDFSMSGGPGPEGLWRVDEITMNVIARMIIHKAVGVTMRFIY